MFTNLVNWNDNKFKFYVSLTESDRAVCGNRIVDPGEECDCGYEDQCTDQCCTARTPGKSIEQDPNACKLKVRNGVKVQCR